VLERVQPRPPIGATDGGRMLTLVIEQTLERIASAEGKKPADVVADLLRGRPACCIVRERSRGSRPEATRC